MRFVRRLALSFLVAVQQLVNWLTGSVVTVQIKGRLVNWFCGDGPDKDKIDRTGKLLNISRSTVDRAWPVGLWACWPVGLSAGQLPAPGRNIKTAQTTCI
jgi:hypothetical protein